MIRSLSFLFPRDFYMYKILLLVQNILKWDFDTRFKSD